MPSCRSHRPAPSNGYRSGQTRLVVANSSWPASGTTSSPCFGTRSSWCKEQKPPARSPLQPGRGRPEKPRPGVRQTRSSMKRSRGIPPILGQSKHIVRALVIGLSEMPALASLPVTRRIPRAPHLRHFRINSPSSANGQTRGSAKSLVELPTMERCAVDQAKMDKTMQNHLDCYMYTCTLIRNRDRSIIFEESSHGMLPLWPHAGQSSTQSLLELLLYARDPRATRLDQQICPA